MFFAKLGKVSEYYAFVLHFHITPSHHDFKAGWNFWISMLVALVAMGSLGYKLAFEPGGKYYLFFDLNEKQVILEFMGDITEQLDSSFTTKRSDSSTIFTVVENNLITPVERMQGINS